MKCSEYVSIGHPDKVADFISSYILDRYIEKDPDTRYAVEVQIAGNNVTLGGEVSSKAAFTPYGIECFVKEALDQIGYTPEYGKKWGAENTISSDTVVITSHLRQQSPDIAQGLTGWGDQGIMFGLATRAKNYMPKDFGLAKEINNLIYDMSKSLNGALGLDIKTQIIMDKNDKIKKVIVAVPLKDSNFNVKALIEGPVRRTVGSDDAEIIINGTGRYVMHSPIADCGTTGRKLAVDFYGGHGCIGGGSPWTKDGSKADLTLNMYARKLALDYLHKNNLHYVKTAIACCIGKKEINIAFYDECNNCLTEYTEDKSPAELIEMFELKKPIFAELCANGLFSRIK